MSAVRLKNSFVTTLNVALCGPGDVTEQVNKRLQFLTQWQSLIVQNANITMARQFVLKVIRCQAADLLCCFQISLPIDKQSKYSKKQIWIWKLAFRSGRKNLEQTNAALAIAREKAEQAHSKKSLYLKACSHDLMQPLEAARLFTSALAGQNNLNEVQQRQVQNIDRSLKVASDLIGDLAEIARIESGNISPNFEEFALG